MRFMHSVKAVTLDLIVKWRGTRSAVVLLTKTTKLLNFQWTKTGNTVWTAPTDLVAGGYQIGIELRDKGAFVMCTAFAELIIDREWIDRMLALRLLEANILFPYGAFRLHDRGDGMREIVFSHMVEARHYGSRETALIALKLIHQLEVMLSQLYACDLIEANPRTETEVTKAMNDVWKKS